MIRFLPDTWRDAIMRPLAMASPDNGVYVEIAAPDLRFALILVFGALLVGVTLWHRASSTATPAPRSAARPAVALSAWLVAVFVLWLATTGNGRYILPALLLAGPVCIALIARLPGTPQLRLSVAVVVVLLQGWVVYNDDPLNSWGLSKWIEPPYFQVDLDARARTEPATYVTVTNISYSLIAPQFPSTSRWVNLSALPDASRAGEAGRRMQEVLSQSGKLELIVPTRPDHMTADKLPSADLRAVLDDMLVAQRLALAAPLDCRMLKSRGLARSAFKDMDHAQPATVEKIGFWVCALTYPVAPPPPEKVLDPKVNAVFALVEKQCPRFFESGQAGAGRIEGGWVRAYPQADIRLYVMDNGDIYYKYWRALNPERLGTAESLQAGGRIACEIRGRTGLPWEREI